MPIQVTTSGKPIAYGVPTAQTGALLQGYITISQVKAWLAANGTPLYIYTVYNALAADIASTANIEWSNGTTMVRGDPLDSFIETTLGFQLNFGLIGLMPR